MRRPVEEVMADLLKREDKLSYEAAEALEILTAEFERSRDSMRAQLQHTMKISEKLRPR